MSSTQFDPFGERVAAASTAATASHESPSGSVWLMRCGTIVFWSLAAGIVIARAVYFDPDWAARLDQAVAFMRSLGAATGV